MASISAARRVRVHAPWSAAAWRDTVFVVSGVPLQLAGWLVLGSVWTVWAPVRVTPILVLTGVSAILLLLALRPLTSWQRERCWAMLGLDIPRMPDFDGGRAWDVLRDLRSPELWRVLQYHLLAGPFLALGGLAVTAAWAAGLALATSPAYAWAVHPGDPLADHPQRVAVLTAVGVLLLAAAPWAAAGVRRLDARAAAALLGPDRAKELQRRVEDLAEKRASVVDAADLERRRIERDLHDGAQQRLVSLALNLGLARETLTGVPDEAMRVIVEAHEEAKAALTELRDLIRGLHPAVLEDRGLDAALSGVAARVPLPVRLRVDIEPRASSTVEAVAYFVVSEALTNVVKHARANEVDVRVERRGDVLRVTVRDDGAGGADPSAGTGLTGLARRVRSVDGTFRITSPAGGPTTVTVELPCAL
ncbi:signal transduction histidine kinase [Actinomadura coerulea]|uniref:histidine kinase n=1 Tax=Actinomadura coerulea TaxID=46159 RepID=A0A7X0KZX0_9ACTN|nr:sensor histidine kinase [Actinomadura coerulea]MBB6396574.1 signal transduction histidine kinase [Actinomadura coerulea]GGQ05271.1 histidine kinase [Actinomadura coerulea]